MTIIFMIVYNTGYMIKGQNFDILMYCSIGPVSRPAGLLEEITWLYH